MGTVIHIYRSTQEIETDGEYRKIADVYGARNRPEHLNWLGKMIERGETPPSWAYPENPRTR